MNYNENNQIATSFLRNKQRNTPTRSGLDGLELIFQAIASEEKNALRFPSRGRHGFHAH